MNQVFRKVRMGAGVVAIFALMAITSQQAFASKIYTSSEKDNVITIIDAETMEVLEHVKVGRRPRGILLSKDKKQLYICTSDDNHIDVNAGVIIPQSPE